MSRFADFRRLHRAGEPLFLPNAWDVASTAALAAAGHRAVGTTSLGVAAAAGIPDAAGAARAETIALARAVHRLPVLLSVDLEAGFANDPTEVADLAAELVGLGVVGVNLEDGRPGGGLAEPERQAAVIAAVRTRAPELFVNARTDTHWLGTDTDDPLAEAIRRGRAYLAAGADGVFVPGLATEADIGAVAQALAPAPLNVLFLPGRHSVPELARLGVARISTGSLLFRVALGAAVHVADQVRAGGAGPDADHIPSYAQVQQLVVEHHPQSWAG